jgi:hypothetical protein
MRQTEGTTKSKHINNSMELSAFGKSPIAQLLKNFLTFSRHTIAEKKIEMFMTPTHSHEEGNRSSVRSVMFFQNMRR